MLCYPIHSYLLCSHTICAYKVTYFCSNHKMVNFQMTLLCLAGLHHIFHTISWALRHLNIINVSLHYSSNYTKEIFPGGLESICSCVFFLYETIEIWDRFPSCPWFENSPRLRIWLALSRIKPVREKSSWNNDIKLQDKIFELPETQITGTVMSNPASMYCICIFEKYHLIYFDVLSQKYIPIHTQYWSNTSLHGSDTDLSVSYTDKQYCIYMLCICSIYIHIPKLAGKY
jgi:hypothetical protein